MEGASNRRFPLNAHDYKLYEEVGEGVSAIVYRALCVPLDEIVAIKVLDLERCNNDLDGIRREVQTMSLINHPNLLQAHCSFATGHHLWVVMPYMAGGSCLQIMKYSYPEGFEEPVIAILLHEVLKALVYLHSHGHIHRDVKSGNILVDTNGAVKLADFGVSAGMFDTGDRQRTRNTFVGTPCWMAPEVMQQLHGYDFKADIWSFGITALELAHGHAPFSKYPPMKVLLMTLQNAPPGLDYERDKRFSKSFKDMVSTCLVKDPKKRPSSEKLLKHSFFKHVKSVDFLACTILASLPPLGERFSRLKEKEAALLVQNKSPYEDKDQLSQQEYIRGISAWNFNLEDLKSQAALIQDYDEIQNAKDVEVRRKLEKHDEAFLGGRMSPKFDISNDLSHKQDEINDLSDLRSSFYSFPNKSLDALKDCFDVSDDVNLLDSKEQLVAESSPKDVEMSNIAIRRYSSVPITANSNLSSSKAIRNGDCDVRLQPRQHEGAHSSPLAYRHKKDANISLQDGPVVQRKGRFKVSAELAPKGLSSSSMSSVSGTSSGPLSSTFSSLEAATLLPSLRSILHQNSVQREELIKLINSLEHISGKPSELVEKELTQGSNSIREKELQTEVTRLEKTVASLVEELQNQKTINAQLEKQMKDFQSNGRSVA